MRPSATGEWLAKPDCKAGFGVGYPYPMRMTRPAGKDA